MIFGSFGLLIVALALLIGAIVKSSVAIGVASLVCTAAAVGSLAAANALYRKGQGAPALLATPAVDGGTPAHAVMMVPQMAMAGVAHTNGYAPPPLPGPPVDNFDDLNATQAASSVALLNLDQLHALRRHEVEHAARKTVLGAIDERITALVALRRTLNG